MSPEVRQKRWLDMLTRVLTDGTSSDSLWLWSDGSIEPYREKNQDYLRAAANLQREMDGQAQRSIEKAEDFDGMTFSEYMRAYNEGFVIGTDKFIARIEKTGDSAVKIAKGSYKLGKYVINHPGDSLLRTVDGVVSGLEAAGEAIANPLETGKKIIDLGKKAIAEKAGKYEEDTSAALIDDGFSVLEFVIGGKLVGRLFGEAGAAEGAVAREAESQAVKEAEKQAVRQTEKATAEKAATPDSVSERMRIQNRLREEVLADDARKAGRLLPDVPSTTTSSGPIGGKPTGPRSNNPRAPKDVMEGERLTNSTADDLARNGYTVEQNPGRKLNGKRPDFLIEGRYFDAYSPSSKNLDQIRKGITNKIREGQAERIIVNFERTSVTPEELATFLRRENKKIDGLLEIKGVNDGKIIQLLP